MTLLLIDKQDSSEQIRDRIATILKAESIRQVQLAVDAGRTDSTNWDMKVYVERANPWNEFIDNKKDQPPIINVWFSSSGTDKSASNSVDRQKWNGTFNIDCYGHGVAQATTEGHLAGDKLAALTSQRAVRLCRNILMSQENLYLGYPSDPQRFVWHRWVSAITSFQPSLDGDQANQVLGSRLVLNVEYNELAPEHEDFNTIEYVSIAVDNDTGEVLAEADFDYLNT